MSNPAAVPGIRTKVHLWWTWLQIASTNVASAKRARNGEASANSFESNESAMLSGEFRNALVATAAIAFAMEALAQELKGNGHELDLSRFEKPAKKTNAGFYIGHRVIQAFRLQGEFATNLPWKLEAIFQLRNDAVHFESEYRDGMHLHPSGTNTAYELTLYTFEQSCTALAVGLSVLRQCSIAAEDGSTHEAAKFIVRELPGVIGMFEEVLKNQDLLEVL